MEWYAGPSRTVGIHWWTVANTSKQTFGTDNSPFQWQLWYDKETGTVNILLESIQQQNNVAHSCGNSIDQIIESANNNTNL